MGAYTYTHTHTHQINKRITHTHKRTDTDTHTHTGTHTHTQHTHTHTHTHSACARCRHAIISMQRDDEWMYLAPHDVEKGDNRDEIKMLDGTQRLLVCVGWGRREREGKEEVRAHNMDKADQS